VPSVENTAAPKKRKDAPPVPPVSGTTRRIVLTGAVIALICAEAWSAPTLFALAEMAKSPRTLAWLLPAVLDTYAATSIWFGNNVPKTHPAHGPAISNTRRALLLTVSANAVFHLLTLAGKQMPIWVPIALLIVVMALPIYIADRLVHLYVLASGNGAEPATDRHQDASRNAKAAPDRPAPAFAGGGTAAALPAPTSGIETERTAAAGGTRPPSVPSRSGSEPAAVVVPINGSGRRKPEEWATLALPLWQQYVTKHDDKPTAPALANLLRNAHPELVIPASERWERNVRSDTKDLADAADTEPERADWAVTR
jgi:hypothetical protein